MPTRFETCSAVAPSVGGARLSLAAATILWAWPRPTVAVVHGAVGGYLLAFGIWQLLLLVPFRFSPNMPTRRTSRTRQSHRSPSGLAAAFWIPSLVLVALIEMPPNSLAIGLGGCFIISALFSLSQLRRGAWIERKGARSP